MHIRNPMEWVFEAFEGKAGIGSASPAEYWPAAIQHREPLVGRITRSDLKEALKLGWDDFAASRTDLVMLWLIYPALALFIAADDRWGTLLPLLFPTASGFTLVGPFFAIGLYEMSRKRGLTGQTRWLDSFGVLRSPSIGKILILGLGLIALFFAWLGVALGIYSATMGPAAPASTLSFINDLFTTSGGWAMIALGTAAGAVFAVCVLALSAVSFPVLLDRDVSLDTAIRTSVQAVRLNPGPMALWGAIVAAGMVLGSLPCFIGLIVVLPVLGHSTWHLYKRLVQG